MRSLVITPSDVPAFSPVTPAAPPEPDAAIAPPLAMPPDSSAKLAALVMPAGSSAAISLPTSAPFEGEPRALAPRSPVSVSRLEYVRGSAGSPICLSFAVFAGCVGLGYAGVIGAVLAVACVLAIGVHAARYRVVRRFVEDQARTRARASREARRVRRLRPAGATRQQHYDELRALVEEVERRDPGEAVRYELQDLLEHFVDLAVSHQRCADALRLAGASALPNAFSVLDVSRSARRRDILQRRIRHRDECLAMMAKLTDEIEGIDDLIRLVIQRVAATHAPVELDRELDRRLWELDEVDAAMRQLSA
ncbi:MAG TPA: hypothetical protein VFP84_28500 [Kofleriaceae bacterium]|nr:hypothetical protein [Kofleriaceae bacterium]